MRRILFRVLIAALAAALSPSVSHAQSNRLPLASGWSIQSSAAVGAKADAISRVGFSTAGWHSATVPGTIVGALVEQGRYPDPYTGMNLRSIPGTTYPIGQQFALVPMPPNSPYKVPWWYRREFDLVRPIEGRSVWL